MAAGATRPAGKPDSCEDALGKPPKQNQHEFVAKEVPGAQQAAMKKQVYGAPENMKGNNLAEGSNPKTRLGNSWGVKEN